MARMRMTVEVRNVEGLKRKLRARTQRQETKLLEATAVDAERVYALAQSYCPEDTGYMKDHLRLTFTRGGFNYRLGWRREDFVGQTNPLTGRVITDFYPLFVVYGTRYMAGRDPITPALEQERRNRMQRYRRALAA